MNKMKIAIIAAVVLLGVPLLMILIISVTNVSILHPSGPEAGYPCGIHGISCGNHKCCDENEVCGGKNTGCAEGMCCFVGEQTLGVKPGLKPPTPPREQRHEDAGDGG